MLNNPYFKTVVNMVKNISLQENVFRNNHDNLWIPLGAFYFKDDSNFEHHGTPSNAFVRSNNKKYTSKHEALTHCYFNVGPKL